MPISRLLLVCSLVLTPGLAAHAADMSKEEYRNSKADLMLKLRSEEDACGGFKGNAKNVCLQEALGRERVAAAELLTRYEPSARHDYELRMAKANASYAVAKEKCNDMSGKAKESCRQEAEHTYITAKAQAKLNEKTSESKQKAAQEIREAQYQAAVEKCGGLAGGAKVRCLDDAKTRYGKN